MGMIVSIGLFIASAVGGDEVLVFWGETVGLVSFGISWLTASRVLPLITLPSERERLVTAPQAHAIVTPVQAGPA